MDYYVKIEEGPRLVLWKHLGGRQKRLAEQHGSTRAHPCPDYG